jgi:hypothetical protein
MARSLGLIDDRVRLLQQERFLSAGRRFAHARRLKGGISCA